MISIRHEGVYHAAKSCQAASLSLTRLGLRGQKKACRIERQKTGRCFAWRNGKRAERSAQCSSGVRCMLLSGLLKDGRLILCSFDPHGKENAYPDVSKCTHSDTVTFAFSTFALIVGHGPLFGLNTLPGKLLQDIAQRFDAGIASMGFS